MITRRVFLKSSGLALVSFGAVPRALLRSVYAADGLSGKKTLVVVFQRGACDGLNTVVPYAEEAYRKLRPTIAVPSPRGGSREAALDLDGFFGLHPALEPLMPLWTDKSLAVVHAVGSPDGTRSHFDAQDFMESGTPGRKATEDGWMNRILQNGSESKASLGPTGDAPRSDGGRSLGPTGDAPRSDGGRSPFRGVSLTPTLPRSLAGRAPAVAMSSIREFGLRTAGDTGAARGFEDMYQGAVHDVLHGTGQETFEAVQFLKKADPTRYQPSGGAEYPRGAYGESLRQIAQLIKADVGMEVAFTEVGGWDHHAAEGGVQGQLAARLRDFGGALAAFRRDLGDRMRDVVLVTLTEFGRTVRENGNRGTDHGHASVSFVLGGPVAGGKVQGRWPGLSADRLYEGRDLAITTDFRDLLGELASRHLGAKDLGRIFPGHDASPQRFPGVIRA